MALQQRQDASSGAQATVVSARQARVGLAGIVGRAVRNPIVGILVSVTVSVLIYVLSIYEVRPQYAVSVSEVVASKSEDVQGIRILFGGQEVNTLRRVTLVLWNGGDKPLDHNALSADQPLCIRVPASVRILGQKVVHTSRPSLRFEVAPSPPSAGCMPVRMQGDDALERNDGVAVELLYDGPVDAPFGFEGRVKGVPTGVAPVSWDRAIRKKKEARDWIFFVNFVLLTLAGARMLWIEIRRTMLKQSNNIVLGSFCFIPLTGFNLYLALPLFFGLSWVR